MIRVRIDRVDPTLAQSRRVAEARMEHVREGLWRVQLLDNEGGRWSTGIEMRDAPSPLHVLKHALEALPDEEECAWCGRTYRRLLRDGVCGGCRAMLEARR